MKKVSTTCMYWFETTNTFFKAFRLSSAKLLLSWVAPTDLYVKLLSSLIYVEGGKGEGYGSRFTGNKTVISHFMSYKTAISRFTKNIEILYTNSLLSCLI